VVTLFLRHGVVGVIDQWRRFRLAGRAA
jgi:hypothetical protein